MGNAGLRLKKGNLTLPLDPAGVRPKRVGEYAKALAQGAGLVESIERQTWWMCPRYLEMRLPSSSLL